MSKQYKLTKDLLYVKGRENDEVVYFRFSAGDIVEGVSLRSIPKEQRHMIKGIIHSNRMEGCGTVIHVLPNGKYTTMKDTAAELVQGETAKPWWKK